MKQLNNMKVYQYHKYIIIMVLLFGTSVCTINAQDSAVSKTELSVSYFLPANKVPYLEVSTKKKVGRKFEPVKNIPVSVYLSEAEPTNLLGKVTTDASGKGRIGIPASFKNTWDSLNEFKFIAQSDSSAGQESLSADITIKKAILTVDTTSADGTRMVTAQLKEKSGNDWVAIKNIDMKLGIKRMLGNLSVGDEATYTSDSTGVSSAEFKRDSLPGDQKGNIILVAEVDDNDTYGNLVTEKNVNWGAAVKPPKNFFAQRTLWSTRFETPIWLLIVAYSIGIGVWCVIFYLIWQIVKIKRLGANA
ncbi:hypothetical protein FW778_03370 [Ginsengibacter hankyongi]|uniref:DUF3324 domain-containing protein n=1 Tax=Ginsengibacter hankyongi TaxID=2607284 RepID=A0A5J5IMI1_9BACT|nr:hypothetical protein [Ginsengibacter hankyongi]KAA9041094.1 hypothetical protein FW778_03370 [Ginsengibacter hankyongi]